MTPAVTHIHCFLWDGIVLVSRRNACALLYQCSCGREMHVACGLALLKVCQAYAEHPGLMERWPWTPR